MAPIYTAHDQSNTRIYAGESMKQTTKTEIQSMHNNIFDSLRAVRKRERERRKTAEELIQLVVVFTTNPLNKCFLIIHFRTVRCDQNHRFLKRIDVVVGIDCCCCWHCCCLR